MKSIMKKVASVLLVVPALVLGLSFVGIGTATPAYAADPECDITSGLSGAIKEDCSKGEGQTTSLFGDGGVVTTIINIMLFIIGILCVIMIIFGGIRYVTSTGDKGKVDGAKNTIIYAVVGLIVAMVAYALVNWVFTSVGSAN